MFSWRSVPSSIELDDTRAVDDPTRRRLLILCGAVLVTAVGGTVGFMSILGESWHEALYRTIVSASLTGLDTTPKGFGGEALTVAIVLGGVAIFGYLAAQVVDSIANGILAGAWKETKRRKMIDRLSQHIIVCGYGRVGRRAVEEFRLAEAPYVVLDFSDDAVTHAREQDVPFIRGNGAVDEDLERAGIDRARGLIVASDDDADNLYITLSAKARRPDLTVIARASREDAERKLRLAGADRVVTPYTTAGRVMANLMIKPQVTSYLNLLTSASENAISFEEIAVNRTCSAVGKTIGELDISAQTGAYVVAVRKADGSLEVRPSKDTMLEENDVIVGIGSPDEITRLERIFEPRAALAT
jgi:voltage-gated potassium channel